jgi:hypothetical protein
MELKFEVSDVAELIIRTGVCYIAKHVVVLGGQYLEEK